MIVIFALMSLYWHIIMMIYVHTLSMIVQQDFVILKTLW